MRSLEPFRTFLTITLTLPIWPLSVMDAAPAGFCKAVRAVLEGVTVRSMLVDEAVSKSTAGAVVSTSKVRVEPWLELPAASK
jgi:hypothetical protein